MISHASVESSLAPIIGICLGVCWAIRAHLRQRKGSDGWADPVLEAPRTEDAENGAAAVHLSRTDHPAPEARPSLPNQQAEAVSVPSATIDGHSMPIPAVPKPLEASGEALPGGRHRFAFKVSQNDREWLLATAAANGYPTIERLATYLMAECCRRGRLPADSSEALVVAAYGGAARRGRKAGMSGESRE